MQPISGDQWTRVSGTAAGTTIVKASSTVLRRVVIGANKAGTVAFYDNASGTSAASLITTLNNNSGSIPTHIDFGLQCKDGLVAESSGVTDLVVVYQ